MPRHRPQPWYTRLNPTPKGPHDHGQYRRSPPSAHRDPPHGADPSPGAKDDAAPIPFTYFTWATGSVIAFVPTPPAPPAIPYAGITTGEIIGHRLWYVTKDLSLCSLAHIFIWEPGATIEGKLDEMVDTGLSPLFSMPILGGVYSFAAEDQAKTEMVLADPTMFPLGMALMGLGAPLHVRGIARGRIKCWGEVIEHEKGYRAQFAKLTSIDGVVGPVDIDLLRERYKV